MRVLITGIAGFAGSHLAEYIIKNKKGNVFGIDLPGANKSNIQDIRNKIKYYSLNLNKKNKVFDVIKRVKPEVIFHLAALSSVKESLDKPVEFVKLNSSMQINILRAIIKSKIDPVIHIACSSEEYGRVRKNENPVTETTALKPVNPYAVSKVDQDLLGWQYYKSFGLKIIRTRAFNNTGPRRPPIYVCSDFARQIALAEKKRQPPVISVGELSIKRDFTDIRDIVRAYWLCAKKCKPGEVYNICSGKAYSIRQVLNMLCNLSKVKVKIKKAPGKIRPIDVPCIYGDCSKFKKATGWKPKISLDKTLKDLLNYWRGRV